MENLALHLNHQDMVGTAYIDNPPITVEQADQWLKELVQKIEMTVLMGPFSIDCVTEGNEGITGVIVIETSHASFHCWHNVERPFMKFDVYSCMPFDAQVVIDHFSVFSPNKINYVMLDRNEDTKVVEDKTIVF